MAGEQSGSGASSAERAFTIGAPLALAAVEIFHPRPHDVFDLDTRIWLAVHYLQIPLFPLAALAAGMLIRGRAGALAALSRAALFVFAVTWTAFDTAAGVVTGTLVEAARASGTSEAWRAAVMAVWTDPILGGVGAPVFAIAGSMAWLLGTALAAAELRRAGSSWLPVVLLAMSGLGFLVFRSHAFPGGPITFGLLALAAAWLQVERAQARRQ